VTSLSSANDVGDITVDFSPIVLRGSYKRDETICADSTPLSRIDHNNGFLIVRDLPTRRNLR